MAVAFSDESLKNLVAESPLFDGLPHKTINQLLEKLTPLKLISGETLFDEGSDGKALYLIASGRLSIHVTIKGKEEKKQRTVGFLSRGDVAGGNVLNYGRASFRQPRCRA